MPGKPGMIEQVKGKAMNRVRVNDDHTTFTRISKPIARNRYDAGKPVYMIACKMRPGNPWSLGMTVHPKTDCYDRVIPFNVRCQNFAWYNCSWETGYYPAFYIES